VQSLIDFVRTLGAGRIAAMAAVTAALIGFFAFLILTVTAVPMTPLFTDLTPEDSSAIIRTSNAKRFPMTSRMTARPFSCRRTG
jgi:flagellar M-ring protein FliF